MGFGGGRTGMGWDRLSIFYGECIFFHSGRQIKNTIYHILCEMYFFHIIYIKEKTTYKNSVYNIGAKKKSELFITDTKKYVSFLK